MKRVAEPVQVYLEAPDAERLRRLTAQLDASKSDVLRRGLEALESQVRPRRSPARKRAKLPTYKGKGVRPGVDLDDTSALLDLMEGTDASR
jgi:hypothetical protein